MAGHIPWRTVDLRLQAGRSIWVATTRPDGRPHAVPVWYLWDGEARTLCFVSGRETQKGRNLRAQPWVVVHLGDGDDVVILEGPAEEVTDGDEVRRLDGLYGEKYVDPGSGARASMTDWAAGLYRVRVRHVMAWEYGTVGHRTDWRFPAPVPESPGPAAPETAG